MSKSQHGGPKHGGNTSVPQVTGVGAVILKANTVYVTWDLTPNATTYWVYRNQQVLAIIPENSYTDNYATPGTYTYNIAAVVNSVLGPQSVGVTITMP